MTRGRVPLDRALSKLGVASRTDARRLIAGGQVSVGGATVTDAGRLVTPERDVIAVDGIPARRAARRLIAFHKPRGVVTTRRDPEGRRTIYDVLGPAAHGLQAIGRLDRASTGLLLLTNDTRLADALTDPGRQVPRTYVVTVRGRLDPARAETLTAGLDVAGTSRRRPSERLKASTVAVRKISGRETHLIVTLTEGRNRELRRLFAAIGHEVTRVHRIAFGPYVLGDLQPGEWREQHATGGAA